MIALSGRTLAPAPLKHRKMVSAISLVLFAAVLSVVLLIALRSPLKDDIAWLLYVARRWMAGHELYVDVVEVNPPLIVWISAIPVEIGRWLGVDPRLAAVPVPTCRAGPSASGRRPFTQERFAFRRQLRVWSCSCTGEAI